MKWDWIPNRSVGPLQLGQDISKYIAEFGAERETFPGETDKEFPSYRLPKFDVAVDTENGKVASITMYRGFLYKGVDIIGLSVGDLEKLLGCSADEVGEPVVYDNGAVQIPYDFFDLGLQVWVGGGSVYSATCLDYDG